MKPQRVKKDRKVLSGEYPFCLMLDHPPRVFHASMNAKFSKKKKIIIIHYFYPDNRCCACTMSFTIRPFVCQEGLILKFSGSVPKRIRFGDLQSCLKIAPNNLSLNIINCEFLKILIPYCPERGFYWSKKKNTGFLDKNSSNNEKFLSGQVSKT